jgi:hypothetical protein
MSMKSMMTEAATLAGDGAAAGKRVLVLFPCSLWHSEAHQYLDDLGGEDSGIYIRYSNFYYSLNAVVPDILILVAVGYPGWLDYGLHCALDKLQATRGKVFLLYLEDDNA